MNIINKLHLVSPSQFRELSRLIATIDEVSVSEAAHLITISMPRNTHGDKHDEHGDPVDVTLFHRRKKSLPHAATESTKHFLSHRFDDYELYFVMKNVLNIDVEFSNTEPNPARDIDKFDLMRELVDNMKMLSDYLRGVNDPELVNADVKALKAYLSAFLHFLDTQLVSDLPEEIPSTVPQRTSKLLDKIDWSKTSGEVRGWTKTISDLIKLIGSSS